MSTEQATIGARGRGALAELASGAASFVAGFRVFRTHPGTLLLGLLPALLAGLVLATGVGVLIFFLSPIVEAITPFAGAWHPFWRDTARIVLATSLVVTAGILSARVFTALALTIGGPIYERIAITADASFGGLADAVETGFWRSLGDMGRIVLRSILGALAIGVISLIPAVGGVLGAVLGVLFTATVIAREFTLLPLQRRGVDAAARRALLTGARWRILGFGLIVQLCYLLPLGAALGMPIASAGGTHLVRSLRGEPTEPAAGPADIPAAGPADIPAAGPADIPSQGA